MAWYEILGGSHMLAGGINKVRGEIIELEEEIANKFKGVFKKVDPPKAAAPTVEEEEEEEVKPAGDTKQAPTTAPTPEAPAAKTAPAAATKK